jgi:hypothetical protein
LVDYPPKISYDDYLNSLPHKNQAIAEEAYTKCVINYNIGNTYLNSEGTGKRWQLAQQAFLDALTAAMNYPDAFLKTMDNDDEKSSRRLLCTVASSLSHTRYKFLDAKGTVAWAKAACCRSDIS